MPTKLVSDPGRASISRPHAVVRSIAATNLHRKSRKATPPVLAHPKQDAIRRRGLEIMHYFLNHENDVHYDQHRPIDLYPGWKAPFFPQDLIPGDFAKLNPPILTPGRGRYCDCSGSVTEICELCGAPDPNGLGYSGAGYTGTMVRHLPEIQVLKTQVLDLGIIWQGSTTKHVVMVMEPGPDPIVFSHGFEGGPIKLSGKQELTYHPGCTMKWYRTLAA